MTSWRERLSSAATRRRLGQALVAAAVLLAAWPLGESMYATCYQRTQLRRLGALPEAPTSVTDARSARTPAPKTGDPIGILEVPRLGVAAVVAHGDDAGTLAVAVGHLPDSPLPWADRGNAALAGHRDTFFRPLRHIAVGDEVVFRAVNRDTLRYRVTGTRVVEPTAVDVLAPTRHPTLTLITCYPFNDLGAAPQRFVVSAVRIGA